MSVRRPGEACPYDRRPKGYGKGKIRLIDRGCQRESRERDGEGDPVTLEKDPYDSIER